MAGLRHQHMVRGLAKTGSFPAAVIVLRLFKTDLRSTGIVAFQEMGAIAAGTGLPITAVDSSFEGFVTASSNFSIHFKVHDQTVPLVTALPGAINKSLVQRMHSDHISTRF